MKSTWGRHPLWSAVHGAIMVAGFALLVSAPIETRALPLLGQPSPFTVTAQSRVTFIDVARTNQEKLRAETAVPKVFDSNSVVAQASVARAESLFRVIRSTLSSQQLTTGQKRQAITQLLQTDSVDANAMPQLTAHQWRGAQYWSLRLLHDSVEITPFDSNAESSVLLSLFSTLPQGIEGPTHRAVYALVDSFIRPTLVIDKAATRRKQQEAAARVKPITVTVSPGTVVVRRGQTVTPAILQELHAVGLPTTPNDWRQRVGGIVFATVVIILLLWHLRAFYPETAANQRLMFLLDGVVVATAVFAKIIVPGHVLLPYFFPVAAAAALTGLLVSSDVGVSIAVVMALLVGWVVGGSFELTTYYLLTGVTAALAVRQIRHLNDFILAGVVIALSAAAVIASFQLLDGGYDLLAIRNFAAAAAFNGLISGALAFGALVLLGNAFGVTTSFHLLELGHPDQKLLRRLMAEAPGTYNHSLVVASMVERAAREIDANVLLARVMALYHDIGKTANPLCFIENQMGAANIHDDLRPEESAEIIRGHVTHGVNLIRQHRLPAPLRDAVLQHHGTMTMPYFFHRALQQDPNVDAAIFTYPGPRPDTKECGLLMLADGCESAVRSMSTKSAEIIRDTVNRMIDERVASGQLSDCQLTLRDLDAVRTAFVEVLNGIYHPRIEYPAALPLQSGNSANV